MFRALVAAVASAIAAFFAVYTVSLSPLKATMRGAQIGTASARVIVDGRRSLLTDASVDLAPYYERAPILARYALLPDARRAIASRAGVKPSHLAMDTQTLLTVPEAESESQSPERARVLDDVPTRARLFLRANPTSPVVRISVTASDVSTAVRLADATAETLVKVARSANANVDPSSLVSVRRVSTVSGTVINPRFGISAALLLGSVLFVALMVVSSSVRNRGR